jgi:hypothetical protein
MFPHHTLEALNPSVARGTPRHPIQKARRIRRHSKGADDSIQEKSTPGRVHQPRAVIIENVRGILDAVFEDSRN